MEKDDKDDWRLRGQEKYLARVRLVYRRYRRNPINSSWDHDHCEFCWATFKVEDIPDVLHEGYSTLDEYRWICTPCFTDFRDRFEWEVVSEDGSQ